MADTKTEKTVAKELREAVARAREVFSPAAMARVLDHSAVVAICGNHEESARALVCRNCVYFHADNRALAWLVATLLNAREPLASWLESAAVWHDETTVVLTDPNHVLHHACGGVAGEDCACFAHPLAVARVVNGSAS